MRTFRAELCVVVFLLFSWDALAGRQYYHLDRLGSVQAITDEAGNRVESVIHRPYGTAHAYESDGDLLLGPRAAFGFTGHRRIDTSQLIYMNARYYDPGLGLFVSHDPARQYPNPYSYGDGDPLNGVDPLGESFFPLIPYGNTTSTAPFVQGRGKRLPSGIEEISREAFRRTKFPRPGGYSFERGILADLKPDGSIEVREGRYSYDIQATQGLEAGVRVYRTAEGRLEVVWSEAGIILDQDSRWVGLFAAFPPMPVGAQLLFATHVHPIEEPPAPKDIATHKEDVENGQSASSFVHTPTKTYEIDSELSIYDRGAHGFSLPQEY